MNSKLHAVCDGAGRLLVLLLSEGQMSGYKGAALMFDAIPDAKSLLGDKGYDADWFRSALNARAYSLASRQNPTAKPKSRSTRRSTKGAIKSRTCLANSRIGGASTPATPMPTCQP